MNPTSVATGAATGALHLVAHVGDCGVLIDAARVDSVVDIDSIYPAPGAAPAVLGLAAMRSRVATVVDARLLLGLPPAPGERAARAVVTSVGGHLYAIAVDTLEDVARFDVAARPTGLRHVGDIVSGVADGDGETLLVLDIDRLIEAVDGGVNANVTSDTRYGAGQNNR